MDDNINEKDKLVSMPVYLDSIANFPDAFIQQSLIQEFETDLPNKVKRYKELASKQTILPFKHFSPFLAEVKKSYINGFFLTTISGCQALAEAIIRDFCYSISRKGWSNDFKKRLNQLKNRFPALPEELFKAIRSVYADRDDYHHLNPSVPVEYDTLKNEASDKIKLIIRVTEILYPFEIQEGKLSPKSRLWYTNIKRIEDK